MLSHIHLLASQSCFVAAEALCLGPLLGLLTAGQTPLTHPSHRVCLLAQDWQPTCQPLGVCKSEHNTACSHAG
jgi:hypothetical protein